MFESPLVAYLRRRFNSPLAWVKVFGWVGLVGGSVEGFKQAGWQEALLGAVVGGGVGGTVGLLMGTCVWVAHRLCAGQLEQSVRRPDLWG